MQLQNEFHKVQLKTLIHFICKAYVKHSTQEISEGLYGIQPSLLNVLFRIRQASTRTIKQKKRKKNKKKTKSKKNPQLWRTLQVNRQCTYTGNRKKTIA